MSTMSKVDHHKCDQILLRSWIKEGKCTDWCYFLWLSVHLYHIDNEITERSR